MDLTKSSRINSPILFIVILGFIFWAIYFIMTKKSVLNSLNIGFQRELGYEYKGVILTKYVDKNNHMSTMIVLTNKDNIGINGEFWNKMAEGDSISKVKGDSVIQVFRKGERFNIEIAPFYRKAILKEIEKKNKR